MTWDRLEGLLEGMVRQQAEFMTNQLEVRELQARRDTAKPKQPSENSSNGSSAFTDFIRARDRRMRVGSLDD